MHTKFIGIKTAQSPEDFALWERFLTKTEFARIVEVGTYKWGMSLFFWLWCKTKHAEFFTYDIKFFPATRVIRELGITKCFTMADVFEIKEKIGEIIAKQGVSIVFCDGGNKGKEVVLFSRYLKLGDFLVVHDWGTEITQRNIPHYLGTPIEENETTKIFQYNIYA